MARDITIDKLGRIVIPKEVRRRHRLSGGSHLVLTEQDDRLVLIPRRRETTTEEKAGLIVFCGRLEPRFEDHRDVRDLRLSRLAGPC